MRQIVKMVTEKAGISESQAQTAVNTVASFLKDKLPPGVAGQVDSYLGGNDAEGTAGNQAGGMADKAKGFADKAGGMFGNKK